MHRTFWKILLAAAAISGVGLWQLWPKIAIEPYVSLDAHAPFSQQFSIQNQSLYTISQLLPRCEATDVEVGNSSAKGISVANPEQDLFDHLSPGAKMNATCRIGVLSGTPNGYKSLLVRVWITYKLPIVGLRRCNAGKFRGMQASGGTFVWTYEGADECPVPDI